ncbi:MAG: alpha/beta hydrolase [Paludibacteraceae bacterium]
MKKSCLALLLLVTVSLTVSSSEISKETRTFALKEGYSLQLDIYKSDKDSLQPCLIFVFGGGFKEGSRDQDKFLSYYNYFANNGLTVVAIDYRLGLKGEKNPPSVFNQKPLRKAIGIAVEDLFSATAYLLSQAEALRIDTSQIIISGSSAGAMTVLQADYERRNHMSSDTILPSKFQYAGVIAFAGSIFSTEGLPTYSVKPAPTLFFHGSADKLVPYNKISFFNLGVFGSKQLARRFQKEKYPYLFYTMEGIGHDVATYPMNDFQPEIFKFIKDYVFEQQPLMVDVNYLDPNRETKTGMTPNEYYK